MRHAAFGELLDVLRRQVEDCVDRAAFERRDRRGELRNDAVITRSSLGTPGRK
jgi:hypothetical protein